MLGRVVERTLRWIAIVLSLLVGASFLLFAVDRLGGASRHQQQELDTGQPQDRGVLPEPRHRAQPRRFIDGAAHTLLEPFAGVVTSTSSWARRGIPTALALLLYGVGLGYLARYARGLH